MNKEFILTKITSLYGSRHKFAEALGIKPPSLAEWFSKGVIPSGRINEVFNLLEIESLEDKERALNLPTLSLSYRAKKDIYEKDVPEETRINVTKFSNIYFSLSKNRDTSHELLKNLRKEISNCKFDIKKTAKVIRNFLDTTEMQPFNFKSVNRTLKKFGIDVFQIPFASFSFNGSEERLRALSANKGNRFLILCDSDRTYDEIMFDLTHELVHILSGLMGGEIKEKIETYVDRVAEELIYPQAFIEREFPFFATTEHVTVDKLIKAGFIDLMESEGFFAPRGFAKAIQHYGLIKKDHGVYNWLYNVEHDRYLKYYGKSISISGKMNFDFTDINLFENFVKEYVVNEITRYPLFYNLTRALVNQEITVRAFAEIFKMDSGDVDEFRKDISNLFNNQ